MKRPKIFLLQTPLWLTLSFSIITFCMILMNDSLPEDVKIRPLNSILITIPTLVGMKLLTFIIMNQFVSLIPKLRKQTEEWVKSTPDRVSFDEAQKQLKKATIIIVPICIILVIIGMKI